MPAAEDLSNSPEDKKMLKLATRKAPAKTAARTKTNPNPATEYVVLDYPKNLETITSRQYSVRIGACDCAGMDISIDDQPWQPCRHAVGYWWFDWNNYAPGTHQLVARMHKSNGDYVLSKRRRCKVV
jgi:hypothetical protein